MSIAYMEDLGAFQAEKRSSSQMSPSLRQLTKTGVKNKLLRLDSPTTVQACNELGILVEDLKQKTLDDFKDPLVEEDIMQLRFTKYMQRYNKFIKEVMSRKRKIIRAQQKLQIQSQLYDQVRMTPSLKNVRNSSGTLPVSQYYLNSTFSPTAPSGPNALKTSMSAANTTLPSPIWMNYNKAMSYFRTSHETSEVKNLSSIVGNETSGMFDETLEKFDTALANEVLRFNRIKKQKQKEAKDAFADEIKRIKIMEEMKEKEIKMEEREKKLALEKKLADKEKKKTAEEKLEKIREAEKKYKAVKLEEKLKIQKKLDDAKEKFAREVEEKKRIIAERDARLNEKIRTASEKRGKLALEEQFRRTQLSVDIHQKLYQSEELHNTTMMERTSKAQFRVQKIEEQVEKIRYKNVKDSEDYVQKLVEKLVTKEESIQAFKAQQQKDLKKKEKELAEKNKKIMSQQTDISQKYKDRMKEINDRFQKVQDNLEEKREHDEKSLRIRQEATKIKISEKQDNCRIKERQMLYERQKILDKQKHNEEKVVWLKSQKDIMRQARAEASIQSKIERDRIEEAFQTLTKVTYQKGTSSNLNNQQRRILRDILKPEDYTDLEIEEKHKEQEKREVEEKRKAEVQT